MNASCGRGVGWIFLFSDIALYNLRQSNAISTQVKPNLSFCLLYPCPQSRGMSECKPLPTFTIQGDNENHGWEKQCCPLKKCLVERAFKKAKSKTKARGLMVYMFNVSLVSSRGVVGAQLFSFGLGKTLKTLPFKRKADQCCHCGLTTQGPRKGLQILLSFESWFLFILTFLARCLKSSVLMMRPSLQSGFR